MTLHTLAASIASAAEPDRLQAIDLRCEYLVDPLGIEAASPRLTWIVTSELRNQRQLAYRILAASSEQGLAANKGDLWDSGKIESSATVHIPYHGTPLLPRQRCFWKVMAWNGDGQPGAWSEAGRWEMGLLKPGEWSAKWLDVTPNATRVIIDSAVYYSVDGAVRRDVTKEVAAIAQRGEAIIAGNDALGGDPAPQVLKRLSIHYHCGGAALQCDVAENATAVLANTRWPYLRKSFETNKAIASARLYVTALGMYEIYLNGHRIGDAELAPGWTDYRQRVDYQVYDVTTDIKRGRNALGAIVGPGWFAGRAGLFHIRGFYGHSPALLAQLEITCTDGSVQRLVSDESWRRHDGPIIAADLMDGDMYDARAAIDDWCAPTLDDHDWTPVQTREETRTLECTKDQPVRELMELPTRQLGEPQPGRWTFDLGQNMVGVVRLNIDEPAGTVITIRHGEMLNPDGTIYTENLRGAAATDTYICRGGGEEQWQPKFTYHGFRYVEITGLTRKPTTETITGIVLGTDLPQTGTFQCSDPDLNQLQSNIVWGLRGNYVSIPTDCPQRDERMGWMADTQVFAPTAAFNADVAPFMSKWMLDVDDAQRADGAYADVAPVTKGLSFGTPAWADAGTIVPWTIYQMYGDTRILEAHIDSMKRWVDWCKAHSTNLIRDRDRGNDYGDWLSINADTPKDLIGTAYFAHSADIVSRSLRALGRDDEADRYRQLFEQIRAAFIQRYLDAEGTLTGDTQCDYALALHFDLLTESQRAMVLDRLVGKIESNGGRLSTGFVGVGMLLPVLSEGGRDDVAYRLLMQDAFPSWLFSVKHGATTIWERWNGWTPEGGVHPDASMNSFNHYSLGSCGQWLFEGLGGIQPDPEYPGFEHFSIAPRIGGGLTWAGATYHSIRGEISTRWDVDGDRLTIKVVIPANTTATVSIPVAPGVDVLESGRALSTSIGVELIGREANAVVMNLGSGSYEFTSSLPPKKP